MSLIKVYLFLILPLAIFASSAKEHYGELFLHHFQEKEFLECLYVLDEWERFEPGDAHTIAGIKGSVYLSMGDLARGQEFMDRFIVGLLPEDRLDPMMQLVIRLYSKGLTKSSSEENGSFELCKNEQPSGVKLKYWFGVGQIIAGFLAAPVTGGVSWGLVISGSCMLADAVADALDNQDQWQRELQERQKMSPDFRRNSWRYQFKHQNFYPQAI